MVPQPPSGESAGLKGQKLYRRFFPNQFLAETYQIVDDPTLDHLISWNKEGSTFIVWRQAEFASQVLPKSFKHNNFTSFVRQLYSYGFRKIVPLQHETSDRWEFFNEYFRRGEKHLLGNIRRKVTTDPPSTTASVMVAIAQTTPSVMVAPTQTYSAEEQVLPPNSSLVVESPPTPPCQFLSVNLIEENDKLRRENLTLKEELGKMKVLRDGIMSLMCNYSTSHQAGEVASPVARTMELMPAGPGHVSDDVKGPAKESAVAKLFGVAIGEKKALEVAGDRNKIVSGI